MNIGSGTGYLSTLVGQILASNDTNHGIELHKDAIEYANTKIEQFMKYSDGFNVSKFCKPVFMHGNVHCLDISFRKYNRVCLLYTSPSPRDGLLSRMPSSA